VCEGRRLKPESLAVTIGGRNIMDVSAMSVAQALDWINGIGSGPVLNEREQVIAREILKELRARLGFLKDVGLDYISVDRSSSSLSGGEAQRVKLATELSRRSTGRTLYILDEPTTGLSFEDVAALLRVLQRLVDAGNTVVIIEHHLDVVKNADWVIDLGPGAGENGGNLVAEGTPEHIAQVRESFTGIALKEFFRNNKFRYTQSFHQQSPWIAS
jgi:excinuclease ABC subunit A